MEKEDSSCVATICRYFITCIRRPPKPLSPLDSIGNDAASNSLCCSASAIFSDISADIEADDEANSWESSSDESDCETKL